MHPESRDPDFAHERTFQSGADDKRLHEELQRLSGHGWERALKLLARSTTTANGDDDDRAQDNDEDADDNDLAEFDEED